MDPAIQTATQHTHISNKIFFLILYFLRLLDLPSGHPTKNFVQISQIDISSKSVI